MFKGAYETEVKRDGTRKEGFSAPDAMFFIFVSQNAEDRIALLGILPCRLFHLKLLCSHGDGCAPLLLQNRLPRGIEQQPLFFANEATRAWQAMS
uniref:Uncharacterized protein n=1 Tax=Triticum urartu TaxID=4572 RepID=A0A8R7VCJ4_TRIUA